MKKILPILLAVVLLSACTKNIEPEDIAPTSNFITLHIQRKKPTNKKIIIFYVEHYKDADLHLKDSVWWDKDGGKIRVEVDTITGKYSSSNPIIKVAVLTNGTIKLEGNSGEAVGDLEVNADYNNAEYDAYCTDKNNNVIKNWQNDFYVINYDYNFVLDLYVNGVQTLKDEKLTLYPEFFR